MAVSLSGCFMNVWSRVSVVSLSTTMITSVSGKGNKQSLFLKLKSSTILNHKKILRKLSQSKQPLWGHYTNFQVHRANQPPWVVGPTILTSLDSEERTSILLQSVRIRTTTTNRESKSHQPVGTCEISLTILSSLSFTDSNNQGLQKCHLLPAFSVTW